MDAERCAIRANGVCVAVGSAEIESVAFQSDSGPGNSQRGLVIRLQVLCEANREVKFEGWNDKEKLKAGVSLVDASTGVALRPQRFRPGTEFVGRRLDLIPQSYADEILIFELPRGRPSALHLQLPASAIEGSGTLRFRIPASMLSGIAGRN